MSDLPTTSFPFFSDFPHEIRREIWRHALPGARIIRVERHLSNTEQDKKGYVDQDSSLYPHPTYFSSPSSKPPYSSLLRACKESNAILKESYSLIFPSSSRTWINYSKDFLYLDWGYRYFETPYAPENFSHDELRYGPCTYFKEPEVDWDILGSVKNLAVHCWRNCERGHDTKEKWLVEEVMRLCPALENLVLVDQLHSRAESGDTLVWLKAGLGEDLESSDSFEEGCNKFDVTTLWRDYSEYRPCYQLDKTKILDEYNALRRLTKGSTKLCHFPKIFRNGVVSLTLRNQLLDICVSDENLDSLMSFDWECALGNCRYRGNLTTFQQIRFLQLVLSRISLDVVFDCQRNEVQGLLVNDVSFLMARIAELWLYTDELKEMMIREAEETN